MIYKGILDRSITVKSHFVGKKFTTVVAIKTRLADSKAENSILNEINCLKRVNSIGIGPKLLLYGPNYFVSTFVEGEFILEWISNHTKMEVLDILQKVINQCYQLDQLEITKEEMHHPLKHIIIEHNQPVLIDFERAHLARKPKNVTQCIEFIIRLSSELKSKRIKLDEQRLRFLAQNYKKSPSKKIIESLAQTLNSFY